MSSTFLGADLAARICAKPAPVLLNDSAAILNILEAPIDTQVQESIPSVAATLVELAAQDPPAVWLVIADVVAEEINKNRSGILNRLGTGLKNLDKQVARLEEVLHQVYGSSPPAGLWPEIAGFSDRLDQILTELLGVASTLEERDACAARALQRMRQGRPPSKKGQNLINDCVIFEEYLELLRLLRQSGFDDRAFFVSPNTNDYGPLKNGDHEEIRADLALHQAEYLKDLAHAKSML